MWGVGRGLACGMCAECTHVVGCFFRWGEEGGVVYKLQCDRCYGVFTLQWLPECVIVIFIAQAECTSVKFTSM